MKFFKKKFFKRGSKDQTDESSDDEKVEKMEEDHDHQCTSASLQRPTESVANHGLSDPFNCHPVSVARPCNPPAGFVTIGNNGTLEVPVFGGASVARPTCPPPGEGASGIAQVFGLGLFGSVARPSKQQPQQPAGNNRKVSVPRPTNPPIGHEFPSPPPSPPHVSQADVDFIMEWERTAAASDRVAAIYAAQDAAKAAAKAEAEAEAAFKVAAKIDAAVRKAAAKEAAARNAAAAEAAAAEAAAREARREADRMASEAAFPPELDRSRSRGPPFYLPGCSVVAKVLPKDYNLDSNKQKINFKTALMLPPGQKMQKAKGRGVGDWKNKTPILKVGQKKLTLQRNINGSISMPFGLDMPIKEMTKDPRFNKEDPKKRRNSI